MVMPRTKFKSLAIALPGCDQPVEPDQYTLSTSGIEFVTRQEFAQFQILELDLDVPAPSSVCSHFACSGVVVECAPMADGGTFRVTLLFLDLPDCARKHIDPGA